LCSHRFLGTGDYDPVAIRAYPPPIQQGSEEHLTFESFRNISLSFFYFLVSCGNITTFVLADDFARMPRKRDHGYQSLTSMAIFKALDLISGHSRPLEPSPTVLRPRRPYAIPSHGKAQPARKPSSTWPGAEVPVEFPHLLPRTRSLTPPPSDTDAESSMFLEQTQSPLLNLPPEVLLSIYKEVLGMNTIHIVRRKDKLGHTICKINEQQSHEACKHAQCRGLKLQAGVHVKAGPGYSSLLPLLQTCRKMYVSPKYPTPASLRVVKIYRRHRSSLQLQHIRLR